MKECTFARRTLNRRTWVLALYLSFVIICCPDATVFAKSYLKVGLLAEPKGLNPFQVTDAWTKKVIWLLYQPLYRIDPETMSLIPWLAEDQPIYDPKEETVTFRLREMKWDDGTELSAEDVVFTAEVFKRFRISRYYAYWDFVKKIEAADRRTVRMTIESPIPVLLRRSLTTWIVQKKEWEPVVKAADKKLREGLEDQGEEEALEAALNEASKVIQNHPVTAPSGLGPFKFKEWKKGSYILLAKNGYFFGQDKTIVGRKLGPYIEGVMFKIYGTLNEATLALKEGEIDFLWKGVSHALVEDLIHDPHIRVPMNLDSGYRYLGFNLRKAPISDLAFRRAVAYLIDKDFIVKRILHNYGQRLDTLIPPENTFYFNSNTPVYGEDMDRDQRIKEAYRILDDAGYRWETPPVDSLGSIQKGKGLILPAGKPMPPCTLSTPITDYDTEMAASGQIIQEWLRDFGMDISWEPMTFGALLHKVRNERDFDMFIMGWRDLSIDPDYLRRFFHSSYDSPNEWNYTGYHDAEFNRLAELQAQTTDIKERRKIVMDLQSRLMMDLPYVPLFVPHRMEGIRTDRFEGWTTRVGGVGNIWTFCLLKPIER